MNAVKTLNARIASYRDPEAQALLHFLRADARWSVQQRLGLTLQEAEDNVAQRALDFLAAAEAKLPARSGHTASKPRSE